MRSYIAQGLILTCLAAPVLAQDTSSGAQAPSTTNQAQLASQQAGLLRYGTRLSEAAQKYHLFDKLTALATPDQLDTIQKLRISPSQAMQLLQAVQENLPQGNLDKEAMATLRRNITPKAEQILGADQFDLFIGLVPSPQQTEQARAILKSVAATPEGIAALQASEDLARTLSDEQRRFLGPFLDLMKDPGAPAKAPPALKKPVKAPPGSRMLVFLKKTSLGDSYAEVYPESNYSEYFAHRYRLDGADPAVVSNLSNADGLPVRVLGTVKDDLLSLSRNSLAGPPSLLAISGDATAWRGQMPARVAAASPPTVTLNLGRGQAVNATLDLQTEAERQGFARHSNGGDFMLTGTALTGSGGNITLCDMEFGDWRPASSQVAAAAVLQTSEDFLEHAANSFLNGHSDMFSGGDGKVRFFVSDIGTTLIGCQPGQVRLYGRLAVTHTGLDVLGANAEVVCTASMAKGRLQLTPVPGSLQVRVDYPLYGAMPASWTSNLERIAGSEYSGGVSLPVTDAFSQQILQSGVVVQSQLDGLQLATQPTGDRRTALVSLAIPAAAGAAAPPIDILRNRVAAPGEFTLAVSEDTINSTIKQKLPPMLPILRPVPEEYRKQGGASLDQVEIPQLDLSFRQGQFVISNCVLNVHWSFGPFSGVEPGVRFQGTASVSGSGNPAKIGLHLHIDQLEFLSTRITGLPPNEQQELKDKLIKGMQEFTLELPPPPDIMVKLLSPQTRLVLTGASGSPDPSELLLHGRLDP
ncbi:MAG: hypothetical protein KF760_07635 [Candidatus Eremiobacteraeota bacterium]|nr:hypothetical protein [Candidatus Eremiobacteraeota bacterium]MCW5872084.1 hypothetical protein [Candidatus Eremiobacteraeota bacterium]